MDKIGALSAFVAAAEARSFTIAGRQLGLSGSAVGKGIARLEDRLGVRLFHRSTRSITLTEEGAMFLERCRRILTEVEAAESELAQTSGTPRGTLRVSLPIINAVTEPALRGFMRDYPEVQLDLDFGDRLVDVIEEGFDAVIRAGEVSDSRLMSRVLGEFRLKLVASPDYFARTGTPKVPEDLAAHACLLHRFATSRKFERWPLVRGGEPIDVPLGTAVIANTIEPLLLMAEQGLGIACLPDMLIRDQLRTGRLVTVLDPFVSHVGLMRILWPASRYPSPKLRAFVDFMTGHLFGQPALNI
ncbi:LysR family transcriptional regulator [Sphingomonas sp. JC676]|uniref:LysR family transcriptional regulator n=1 Tax=Sphingomonas sp. JC676 TaxID=2768065 RepID=UPI001657B9CF|nr:LysR family transcriptional regulator [Sphingomonas sp. JC676]MBC9034688.1 LysR family transcriptional regulator [Sphingomonas sp. JC676]